MNNNFIPLHDVGVSVGLGHLDTSQNINLRGSSSLVQRPEWQHRHLDIDEKFTITLSDLFALRNNNKLTDSKIKIVVQYNPWILPLRREKSFTFQLKLQTNNKQYWYDAS